MRGLSALHLLIALSLSQLLTPTAQAADTLFRMTGSNTVGAELAPLLVKGYLTQLGAQNIQQRSAGEQHWISANLQGRDVQVPIIALGSSTGFKALNQDTADIGMASRRIKDKEVKLLSRFGDLSNAEAEHVIGLDALVVTVHHSNPISELSLQQLRDIYSGKIRNWRELGGSDLPIRALHRDIESGTRATFDGDVFGRTPPPRHVAYEVSGNNETHELVLTTPGAIGYLPYADAGDVKKVAIQAGNLPATVPDSGIIATEDFPLTRRLYLYRNPTRYHPHVDSFLRYAESRMGQAQVAEVGFIDLTPVTLDVPAYPNAPEAYRALAAKAQRLSISFRFDDGSAQLDSRSQKDLLRLQTYVDESEAPVQLTLVGFSDQKAKDQHSDLISRFRALKVRGALLRDHNVGDSRVLALGAFAPLTADQEHAPVKNSRVEVWVH